MHQDEQAAAKRRANDNWKITITSGPRKCKKHEHDQQESVSKKKRHGKNYIGARTKVVLGLVQCGVRPPSSNTNKKSHSRD